MSSRIAIIGANDYFMGFRALGVEVFDPQGRPTAEVLTALAPEDYAIVFVAENLAEGIMELIAHRTRTTPQAIIVVPAGRESTGVAGERIRQLVRKAVGADIM